MEKVKKIRKTISISPQTNKALQLLSKQLKKSQSQLIEELVEEKIKEIQKKERLKAFKELIELTQNLKSFLGNKQIQNIKEEMENEL